MDGFEFQKIFSSQKPQKELVDFLKTDNGKKILLNGLYASSKVYAFADAVASLNKGIHIVVMNKEEAALATKIEVRPDTKDIKYSCEKIHPDVKSMLEKLKVRAYQVVVITDGGRGAYAYDGKNFYYCPVFDGPVVSTLGAGDAFASTFCASLKRTEGDIGKSLMYASVNSSGVVSQFGATQGLLTFEEIETRLAQCPEYGFEVVAP